MYYTQYENLESVLFSYYSDHG